MKIRSYSTIILLGISAMGTMLAQAENPPLEVEKVESDAVESGKSSGLKNFFIPKKRLTYSDINAIGSGAAEGLDVYVSKTFAVVYTKKSNSKPSVDTKIKYRSSEDIKKLIVSARHKYKILSIESNADSIFVLPDASCASKDCALEFTYSKGSYVLLNTPVKPGYDSEIKASVLPAPVGGPRFAGMDVYLKIDKRSVHTVTKEVTKAKGF